MKYLQSLVVVSRGDMRSYSSLLDPHSVLSVKQVPPEITGARRKYLKSLEANVAARMRLEEINTTHSGQVNLGGPADTEIEDILEKRSDLLRKREQLQILQILRHYLDEVLKMQGSKDDLRMTQSSQYQQRVAKCRQGMVSPNGEPAGKASARTALTERLEATILNAKSQLELHRSTLEELKFRDDSLNLLEVSRNRREGLEKSRNELHDWVQDKLANSDLVQPEEEIDGPNGINTFRLSPHEIKVGAEVHALYNNYCGARKSLIKIVSTMNEPSIYEFEVTAKQQPFPDELQKSDPYSSPLPFIIKRLLRNGELERQLEDQTRSLSEVLKDGNSSINETIKRLQDESHLLPSYPVLAKQERFREVSKALGRSNMQSPSAGTSGDVNESLKAWRFASAASYTALNEFVHEHFDQAKIALDKSEQVLDSLRNQLGIGHSGRNSNGRENDDIWAAEMDEGVAKQDLEGGRDERGPWSGLNGRIGIS
ncbi:MAG: hypothetical protein Q9160_003802 [Pyrenula sp. 1 TL-2023]